MIVPKERLPMCLPNPAAVPLKWQELERAASNQERNFILVLENGEEAFLAITRFAREEKLTGASLTAIDGHMPAAAAIPFVPDKITRSR